MAGQESLILNDGHSTSIVEALTSGPEGDLAMQASYTPQLGYGYYSPYIASVLDIAKILDSFRTAQYQYIPALATLKGNDLQLTLNAAPSFHNPKSVLVVALPAVEPAQLPPLHAVDPKEIYCARRTALVLPVEGAPLVFSTAYAHDMTLEPCGRRQVPRAARRGRCLAGGFVVDTSGLGAVSARRHRARDAARLLGFRSVSRTDLRAAQCPCRLLAARRRRRVGPHRRTPGYACTCAPTA